jgi:hypothetical protein
MTLVDVQGNIAEYTDWKNPPNAYQGGSFGYFVGQFVSLVATPP